MFRWLNTHESMSYNLPFGYLPMNCLTISENRDLLSAYANIICSVVQVIRIPFSPLVCSLLFTPPHLSFPHLISPHLSSPHLTSYLLSLPPLLSRWTWRSTGSPWICIWSWGRTERPSSSAKWKTMRFVKTLRKIFELACTYSMWIQHEIYAFLLMKSRILELNHLKGTFKQFLYRV